MAEDVFILDSPALESAVKLRGSVEYPPKRPGKNSLESPPETSFSGEYNGYFSLKDISERDSSGKITTPKVAICDGATWDDKSQLSGASILRVNFRNVEIGSVVITSPKRYIMISYNTEFPEEAEIVTENEIQYDSIENGQYFYLLGEYANQGFIQRHSGIGNGMAQIWVVTRMCE